MTKSKQEAILYTILYIWFWILIAFLKENHGILVCLFMVVTDHNFEVSWVFSAWSCIKSNSKGSMCQKSLLGSRGRLGFLGAPAIEVSRRGKEVIVVARRVRFEEDYGGSGPWKLPCLPLDLRSKDRAEAGDRANPQGSGAGLQSNKTETKDSGWGINCEWGWDAQACSSQGFFLLSMETE